MLRLSPDNLEKPIAKALRLRPRARMLDQHTWTITGSRGDLYRVRFALLGDVPVASCECQGAKLGWVCYHVGAAVLGNHLLCLLRQMKVSIPALEMLIQSEGVCIGSAPDPSSPVNAASMLNDLWIPMKKAS